MTPSSKLWKGRNKDKIILDLCGGTGSWSRPYREAGYDVRLITFPDNDVRTYQPPDNVYGILAAPPCTMFSRARTRAKTPRDIIGGLSVVDACIRIIWRCKPNWWALENPDGLLKKYLGKAVWTFQPYHYGESYSKRTSLWGNFIPPMFNPKRLSDQERAWAKTNSRPIKVKGSGLTVADIRAITPPLFAQAFYEANK